MNLYSSSNLPSCDFLFCFVCFLEGAREKQNKDRLIAGYSSRVSHLRLQALVSSIAYG